MIILLILLLIMFRAFFYHHGSGILQQTWENDLYVSASDGHVYKASACKKGFDLGLGNYIEFTAIGLDLSIGRQQISTPGIIRCEFAGWADNFEPLP